MVHEPVPVYVPVPTVRIDMGVNDLIVFSGMESLYGTCRNISALIDQSTKEAINQ